MERREKLFCLCVYFTITAIGFLIAVLIAFKTLTGECEHPEDICYHGAKCYLDQKGFICDCPDQYYGERCQYRKYQKSAQSHGDSEESQKYASSNDTTTDGHNVNGQPVVIMPHQSPSPEPTKHKGDGEVITSPIVRDKTLGPPYVKFIIVFGTVSSLFFITAFFIFYFFKKTNCMGLGRSKSKEYYGIKYGQASQGQSQGHLLMSSNGSNLDDNV